MEIDFEDVVAEQNLWPWIDDPSLETVDFEYEYVDDFMN